MKKAVIYARVSSKEQEREGYSIPAQIKLLQEYAVKHNIKVVNEFTDSETAKKAGRTSFNEMIKFLKKNKSTRTILVEKTDRLYRNFKDYVLLDDFEGLEVHLVKESSIISDNSRSHDKFIHGIKVLMAKNYIDNLSEEIKKGLQEKADQGNFPMRTPYGYKRIDSKNIVVDPQTGPFVKRAFELYSQGNISLNNVISQLYNEGFMYRPGKHKVPKGQLEYILKNKIYIGHFSFKGQDYQGKHPALITLNTFEAAQKAFKKDNKPDKLSPNNFLFSGLLTCGECGCSVVGDIKKQKYIYYRCTLNKGKCSQRKYIREEKLEEQFIEIVNRISITEEHKQAIISALKDSFRDVQKYHSDRLEQLRKQSTKLENGLSMLYADKLDGKITEEFWLKQHNQLNSALIKIKN